MQLLSTIGGIDGAVIEVVAACQFRRREQLLVVEFANGPSPLAHAFEAQIEPVQG